MPSILRLEVTDFAGPATWQWQICGPDDRVIAAHNVALDTTSWQYEAIADLHGYLQLHAAPDRRLTDEARIIALVGEWLGREVFGSIANAIVAMAPVTVEVVLPAKAYVVALYPLESAFASGRALAAQHVSLAFVTGPQGRRPKESSQRLRVLGVFSVPDGSGALNLRAERYELERMLTRAAATRDLEFRILQYGVTRDRLRQVAAEAEGWDIVHVSGHGKPGAILLETAEGGRDLVGAADLVAILLPAASRLRLLMLSACSSASLAAAQQLHLLGLGPAPRLGSVGGADGNAAAVLAADLARELDCAVLAMRYPVGDEFVASLAGSVYGLLLNEQVTLASALQRSLPPLVRTPSPRCPAISLATPALFGRRAARDFLGLHGRASSGSAQNSLPAPFPSQPERFVGRVGALARAGSVLAPRSGRAGIVLYGMAGAGKSACALELAYTHRESFQGMAWFAAPAARPADPFPILTDFIAALEAQIPDFGLAHLLDEAEAVSHLHELTGWVEDTRVLIVIDNAETLQAHDGRLDANWAQVLGALAAHHGLGRLVVTSRNPLGIPGLHEEAVHALSRDEAVLMAGALPNLRRLMEGRGAGTRRDRQAVARVLEVAQGHPKLLELADGQAGEPDGLTGLLTDADRAWQELGGLPRGFFNEAGSRASGEDYAEVLGAWTAAITGRLEHNARLLFEFLCAIEEPDLGPGRVRLVTETAWRDVWRQAGAPARPPRPAPLLRALHGAALAGVERSSDGTVHAIRIHPVVASATRDRTPGGFRRQVDIVMTDLWVSVLRGSDEGAGEVTDTLITAARSAVPYALRLGAWDVLGGVISAVAYREASPVMAATMLPAARRLVQGTEGTDKHLRARDLLAHLGAYADPAALGDQSQILADAVAVGRYDVASSVAADLVSGYRAAGRLAEALEVAQALPEFSRMAGNGPWTRLADERARVQVLTDQGRYEQAAAAVERLLAAADALPAVAGPDEEVQPWHVIENILETGYSAAMQAGDWERALALLDRRGASQRQRNAPPHELALTAFNSYGPLLQLGRTDRAVAVLSYCRGIFEGHRDLRMLGKVLGALAQTEESRGHGDLALSHARDALRLSYAADGLREIASNHANYGIFMALHGDDLTTAAAHLIAAALVLTVIGDAQAEAPLRALSALCSRPVTIPEDVAAIIQLVNAPDGVRFERVLSGVIPGAAAQQQVLRRLIAAVSRNGAPQLAADPPR